MKLSDLPGIRSQRDSQWANVELGFNTDPQFNIGHFGCLVTSMANYLWAIDPSNLTTSNPGLLNNALKENGGFVQGGGDINWAGFNTKIDSRIVPQGVTTDIHTLADWLNGNEHFALIEVTGSHGGFTFPEHWLMGYGVTAGSGAPDALDPWFGDDCEVQGRYTFLQAHLYGDGAPATQTEPVPASQAIVRAPTPSTPPAEVIPPPSPEISVPSETPSVSTSIPQPPEPAQSVPAPEVVQTTTPASTTPPTPLKTAQERNGLFTWFKNILKKLHILT